MAEIYDRLPEYIRKYIYEENWSDFRDIQKKSFDKIYEKNCNVILTAGTASGKTEAAFIPALTEIYDHPSKSVGILYISPLKALINDQFIRIEDILRYGDIPIYKWHGDVSSSRKRKAQETAQGVIQTTPESLEILVSYKKEVCKRLFSDLHYIIIDEMHYFMDSPRGVQLLSVLERMKVLAGCNPVRVGLSATLGDYQNAQNWINIGTKYSCDVVKATEKERKMGLLFKSFEDTKNQEDFSEEMFRFLYDKTKNKKSIIFGNSRVVVEEIIVKLREYAKEVGQEELYAVHHGDISTNLREEVESNMKNSKEPYVTGATVTLELGIDIGHLDRVVQIFAPTSVSSFAQRIGRCGRRGQRAEIVYVHRMNKDNFFDNQIDWEFLQGIASLQLFLRDKWVEPIKLHKKPFSILYHQTMMILKSNGEMKASDLARECLSLRVFRNITQEEYKELLTHLIKINHIEKTSAGMLRIGETGERITDSYKFGSVFEKEASYEVRNEEKKVIGTIMFAPKQGSKFILAGRVWLCEQVDYRRRIIHVVESIDSLETKWFSMCPWVIHDGVMKKVYDILNEDEEYVYLDDLGKQTLREMRGYVSKRGILKESLIELRQNQYALFLWVGTAKLLSIMYALSSLGYHVVFSTYYLKLNTKTTLTVLKRDLEKICSGKLKKDDFVYPEKVQVPNKFNEFVPESLLKEQFIEDYLEYGEIPSLQIEHLY